MVSNNLLIAVVLPCYRIKKHILDVIASIKNEVWRVSVVDDKFPDDSGKYVEEHCLDNRIRVIYHEYNAVAFEL